MKNQCKIEGGIYLFPFTAEAVLTYHMITRNGFVVLGFFDNDIELNGKKYCDCPITLPLQNSCAVIICGHRHYQHIHSFENCTLLDEVLEKSDIDNILELIDYKSFSYLAPRQALRMKRIDYDIGQVLLPDDALQKNALVINSANLLLTCRCTLKCRDCSDLMQYYEHPKDVPFERVIQDLTNVFRSVAFVRNITLVGGEPLIYKKLSDVLNFIAQYRNRVGVIWVTTNGTIIPQPELLESLKASNSLLRISDYGKLSIKKEEIISLCEIHNIRYEVIDFVGYKWRQGKAPLYPPTKCTEDNQQKFISCQSRVICNSIFKGKFYFCEFIAHMEDLKGVPYNIRNGLSLEGVTPLDIRNYFSSKKYAPACAYCTGDNIHDMPYIEPAIQTEEVLTFRSFEQTYGVEERD